MFNKLPNQLFLCALMTKPNINVGLEPREPMFSYKIQ